MLIEIVETLILNVKVVNVVANPTYREAIFYFTENGDKKLSITLCTYPGRRLLKN